MLQYICAVDMEEEPTLDQAPPQVCLNCSLHACSAQYFVRTAV
jgi:hypothetical protein